MLSLFLGSDGLMIEAIHSEGKGRCMCQHVYHGCSVSTEKPRRRWKSPSSANLHELIPPTFTRPYPPLGYTKVVEFAFVSKARRRQWENLLSSVSSSRIWIDSLRWFQPSRAILLLRSFINKAVERGDVA